MNQSWEGTSEESQTHRQLQNRNRQKDQTTNGGKVALIEWEETK